jgi:hypothetical protein
MKNKIRKFIERFENDFPFVEMREGIEDVSPQDWLQRNLTELFTPPQKVD